MQENAKCENVDQMVNGSVELPTHNKNIIRTLCTAHLSNNNNVAYAKDGSRFPIVHAMRSISAPLK